MLLTSLLQVNCQLNGKWLYKHSSSVFNKTDFDQMLPQLPVTRSHNIIERLLRVFGCQIATKVCCGQRPQYSNMNWQANTDKDLL